MPTNQDSTQSASQDPSTAAATERAAVDPRPYKCYIFFGSSPEDGVAPLEYAFASEELLNAFLYGVDESSGWMDYHIAPGPDYRWSDDVSEPVSLEEYEAASVRGYVREDR